MADEQVRDEQSQASSTASSTEEQKAVGGETSASEQSSAEQGSEQSRVPYQRFHEVVEQRNEERRSREATEARFRELESRLPQGQAREDHLEVEAQRLAKELGLKPEAAKAILKSSQVIAREERREVEAKMQRYDVQAWSNALSQKHKDFGSIAPEMDKVYSTLDKATQQMVTSSPASLEMFYGYVKSMKSEGQTQEAFANGTKQAYESKAVKQAVSGVSGTASKGAKGKLTQAAISAMSNKEYKERLPEINRAIAAGEID